MKSYLAYIVIVTEDLLPAALMICLLWCLCKLAFGRRGTRFVAAGMGIGLAMSIAMALMKNLTSKIATNQWNFYIFLATALLTILFFVFSSIFGRKHRRLTYYGSDTDEGIGFGGWSVGLLSCLMTMALVFYELPDVLAYPFNFVAMSNVTSLGQYSLYLAGYLTALLLLWVYVRFLYKCVLTWNSVLAALWVTNGSLLVNLVRVVGMAVSKWVVKPKWLRWLPKYSQGAYPWAFPVAKFATNNTLLFVLLGVGLSLIIPGILFFRNLRIHGRYSNPAEHRKLKATARTARRRALVVACCAVLCVVALTAVQAFLNQKVELSAPEEYELRGEAFYIPVENVNDGNLHRFEYITEGGTQVRWIIVRKPGAGAYGIGLDACDVCGDAGYYQRGEQVVCKRCDVVMNINTIGFKGGCNPVPLSYVIQDGYVIFQKKDIESAEHYFKK